MNEFLELIKEGFRLALNLGTMVAGTVKAAVLGYFNQVKTWTIRFVILAAIPLLVIVPCLLFKLSLGGLYGAYVVWIVLLAAAELLVLTPMFFIWRRLQKFFPNVAAELQEWLDFIKSVVFNGLSLGIFVTLFPVWRAPGAFPLLLLVLICWLTLPACGVSNLCKRIYPSVRAVQLLFLFGLLVMQMAFPRHMEQLSWASSKKIGSALTGSIVQKDITSEWKSLQWFNNQGEPQVWYSGSKSAGFRLWAAPGFDPDGLELRSLKEAKIRDQIVASLEERDRRAQQEQAAKEAEQRRLAEIEKQKQLEADKVRQAAAEAERIRLAADEAKRLAEQRRVAEAEKAQQMAAEKARQAAAEADRIRLAAEEAKRVAEAAANEKRDYIARNLRTTASFKSPGKLALAVGVANGDGRLDETTAMQLSALFPPDRVIATGNLFKPAFATDGVLQKVLGSDTNELARLGLPALTDHLLLGSYRVQFTTNAQLEGIITAKLQFSGGVLKADSGDLVDKLGLEVTGPGFTSDLAEAAAKQRLAKSLSTYRWQFFSK